MFSLSLSIVFFLLPRLLFFSLSAQSTARLGISVGISGIVAGLASTLAYMNPASAAVYAQVCVCGKIYKSAHGNAKLC